MHLELTQNAGYVAESYEVVTQDGYILQLKGLTSSSITPLSTYIYIPVFIHGFLDCSVTWFAARPEVASGVAKQITGTFSFLESVG